MDPRKVLRKGAGNEDALPATVFSLSCIAAYIVIWLCLITGSARQLQISSTLARIGLNLGIAHRPTLQEDLWALALTAAVLVVVLTLMALNRRRRFKAFDAQMSQEDWAPYRHALYSMTSMFAEDEMIVLRKNKYVRIPYKAVRKIAVHIRQAKYSFTTFDDLFITYDDNGTQEIQLNIKKTAHVHVIATRIAKVNGLTVESR